MWQMDWKKKNIYLPRNPAGDLKQHFQQHDDILPMTQIVSHSRSAQQRCRNRLPLFFQPDSKEDQGEPMSHCFVNSLAYYQQVVSPKGGPQKVLRDVTLFFRESRRRIRFIARGSWTYSLLTVWALLSIAGEDCKVCSSSPFSRGPGSISESKRSWIIHSFNQLIKMNSHSHMQTSSCRLGYDDVEAVIRGSYTVYFSFTHQLKQMVPGIPRVYY